MPGSGLGQSSGFWRTGQQEGLLGAGHPKHMFCMLRVRGFAEEVCKVLSAWHRNSPAAAEMLQ